MSIYCQQCGTENEDNSKFCKSCGAALNTGPKKIVDTEKPIKPNSTMQTVKKVAIWIVSILLGIILISVLVYYIQVQNREAKISEMRSGCANNDAKSCYLLGTTVYDNEGKEALAKGCQLGNKNACRAGGYYKQGCNLQDGESCYEYAKSLDYILVRRYDEAKQYYQLSCQYGYSRGCMENQ